MPKPKFQLPLTYKERQTLASAVSNAIQGLKSAIQSCEVAAGAKDEWSARAEYRLKHIEKLKTELGTLVEVYNRLKAPHPQA